jgi:SHS2 domain-containing protein
MAKKIPAGFHECEHTADWELEVWAVDLPGLLEQAARGMYELSHTHLQAGDRQRIDLALPSEDAERLLVTFLAELLWIGEKDGLAFDEFNLRLSDDTLLAELEGAPISSQYKEIKAVTYHNLAIRQGDRGLEVRIVFDV